ncbi:hypothetical protein IFM53868_02846 [Aspergillus udagawae]|uniref:DUF7726 domain-containing protein n=1 Tax=Aspergillus udagawae TaxID=91492 RepID=A0ABQ1AEU6_9EURO|nr:hypothetical protein IFM53868_02846 [Aspergillus udagawae]
MSLKRKSTDLDPSNAENIPPEIDSDDERLSYIDWNCDQVRRRIRAFIESGEMKIGEFQDAIGVSSRSYLEFLGQNGRDKGSGSSTYINAARFFKKRELQGIKPPRKKRATKESQRKVAEKYDVSGIHLDGESDQSVPVWDTCDVSELYHLLLLDLVHDRQDPVQEQTQMIRRTVDASPRTEKTKIANRKKDATTWSLIGSLAGG